MSPVPTADDFRQFREEVITALRELRQSLEGGYVRKDVQAATDAAYGIQLKGLEDEVHLLGKRMDTLAAQRDKERDSLIDRMRGNNRIVVTAFITALAGPFVTLLLAHAVGLR